MHVTRMMNGEVLVRITPEHLNEFKELVHRGTNLWPDASPEMKAFADNITNDGVQMQDYSRPAVTSQPKFCITLGSKCPRGCKHNQCEMKQHFKYKL